MIKFEEQVHAPGILAGIIARVYPVSVFRLSVKVVEPDI